MARGAVVVESTKPAPPKRPMSTFFHYKKDILDDVKKSNPDKKITELTKIVSVMWKKIDDETKRKYEKLAEKNKEDYEAAKRSYEDEHGKIEKKKRKKKESSEDEDKSDEEVEEKKRPKRGGKKKN
eukprot:TRINITY_DN1607_c0_g3_i3.p1 TRINITY_DN1607_c0_g3~~TRINITY_DN1607_c0_g3_i3.p1  ORF type:complete len:126 (-),score=54.77 TRINITY_DN1607_c0_g3_i3:120-497(-)